MSIQKQKKTKVVTPVFRVSFPAVFRPTAFEEGQKPKYTITMLFDKETTDFSEMIALVKSTIKAEFPDISKLPHGFRSNPFRDGDTEKPHLDGYAGTKFASATTANRKPQIIDSNFVHIIDENEFYAGCYARATITAYTYNKKGNKGVAFGLQNLMKVSDGEPFGSGGAKAEDDFAEMQDLVSDDYIDNTPKQATPPQVVKPASMDDLFDM